MEKINMPTEFPKGTPILDRPIDDSEEELNELRALWYGVGYMPVANCHNCKGAGFVHPVVEGKSDYSKIIPCRQKGCLGDKAGTYHQAELRDHSGLLAVKQTFDNFNASVPGVRKSFDAAKKIADGDSNFIWLLLFGGVGNGKSHLLNAIANRVLERGIEVKFVMMADLLSELRVGIGEHQADAIRNKYKDVPYLLLDELGVELGTDWEQAVTDEILTGRWARGRFTVVATNLDLEKLPERIKSRFMDKHLGKCVFNEGADYRIKRGKQ